MGAQMKEEHFINKTSASPVESCLFSKTESDEEDDGYQAKDTFDDCGPVASLIKKARPVFGGWWGKRFGLGPSPRVSSRRPKKILGGEVQEFEKIHRRCQKAGIIWEDPEFLAEDDSIFFSRKPPMPWEWKRPHELTEYPQFISEGVSRFDVRQGKLGDCWLLAAVANLTLYQELLAKVVPTDQSFQNNYCGVFHFQFWQYGHWVDVIIDDRLPTYDGKLVFMHSTDNKEFWSALLEKAYAKLHGSYEALKGGSTSEAMEDFTGGLAEMYELQADPPSNLFKIMEMAMERCALIACSLEEDPNKFEARLPNGLIRGHAYSLTNINLVDIELPNGKTGRIPLLRLRNPWGNEAEWKGAWGDSSQEWTCITESDRKKMGLTFEADGEFWISFQDFMNNFDKLEICNLTEEAAEAVSSVRVLREEMKKWECQSFDGAWVYGATAGGCRNSLDTFACNPQFRVNFAHCTDHDKDEEKVTCVVGLLQKHKRNLRQKGAGQLLTIGFAIYKIDDPKMLDEPLDKEYFRTHVSTARSDAFINLREVCTRFKLPPGTFVIIPSTFDPNEEGEFLLRVFSETKCKMTGIEERTGYIRPQVMKAAAAVQDPDTARLQKFFEKLAGDDLQMDAWELQEVLTFALKKEFSFDEFSLDTCRSLIAVVDLSRTGNLNVEEFKVLWSRIKEWKTTFLKHDVNQKGSINSFQLKDALRCIGYRLHSRVLTALVLRYANQDSRITFDNFIGCAVKLKTMLDIFDERDPDHTGQATFDLDAWAELTMYA